jgi:hypothetical protein
MNGLINILYNLNKKQNYKKTDIELVEIENNEILIDKLIEIRNDIKQKKIKMYS